MLARNCIIAHGSELALSIIRIIRIVAVQRNTDYEPVSDMFQPMPSLGITSENEQPSRNNAGK